MDEENKPVAQTASPKQVICLAGEEIDGRFKIECLIAEGATSTVYKARHLALDIFAALKILHLDRLQDAQNLARFQQEALALSQLSHPAILKIFSSGVLKDGRPYLAMEYVEGRSLADLLAKEKSLDSQTAIEIAIQIARGMAEVHDRGILHRDLKPSNIMLCDDGRSPLAVKVIDFGLVRLQRDSNLTATGIAVGSPAYMSPEQCQNKELSPASDVYSLACIIYEMLSGVPPFVEENLFLLMSKQIGTAVSSVPAQKPVRKGLTNVVLKALKKEPEQRYASMNELVEALQSCSPDKFEKLAQKSSAKTGVWGAAALALLVLSAILSAALIKESKKTFPQSSKSISINSKLRKTEQDMQCTPTMLIAKAHESNLLQVSDLLHLTRNNYEYNELYCREWIKFHQKTCSLMELINAQLMLATACIRQDKRDEAKAIYRQLELAEKESFKKEDSDPFLRASHASRLLDMARIEDNLDKYHEAEAYFKQYLDYIAREYGKNNGDYANGLEALADIYHSQKKFKEEEGVLKELLSMLKVTRAGELHPYLVMASNQFALKRQDVANRYLNTYHERLLSKELRPSPSELSKFLCYLADTYDRCHLYKEEAAIADEIAKINSQVVFAEAEAFTIRARMLAGRAYAQADEYEKSIDRFKQAMQLTKNGYPIESFLAARAIFDQHFKRKKYQEAYQWFEKEIKMFPPPSLNAYQNLLLSLDKARLLEVENKKEEAAEAYLEAAHDCLNHKYSDYPKEYEMEFRKHELLLAMHVHWKKNSQQAVSLCEDILKNSSEKILESSDFLERIVVEYYKILIGQGRTKEANALAEKYPKELRDEAALYKEQQKL